MVITVSVSFWLQVACEIFLRLTSTKCMLWSNTQASYTYLSAPSKQRIRTRLGIWQLRRTRWFSWREVRNQAQCGSSPWYSYDKMAGNKNDTHNWPTTATCSFLSSDILALTWKPKNGGDDHRPRWCRICPEEKRRDVNQCSSRNDVESHTRFFNQRNKSCDQTTRRTSSINCTFTWDTKQLCLFCVAWPCQSTCWRDFVEYCAVPPQVRFRKGLCFCHHQGRSNKKVPFTMGRRLLRKEEVLKLESTDEPLWSTWHIIPIPAQKMLCSIASHLSIDLIYD